VSPDQVFAIVMGSIEERLDFTERVLLQERQAGQLRQGELR
jgi:hypothetical protein